MSDNIDDMRKGLIQLASGNIDNPYITVSIDGKDKIFEGYDARIFAVGVLYGIEMQKDGCNFDNGVIA